MCTVIMAEEVADGRPPELSPEATLTLITNYFPFKHVFPKSFKPLPSYDDHNVYFHGTLEDRESGKEQFVLKLYNCNVYTSNVLEGLDAVMLYLKGKGFPCCHPIASRAGSHMMQSELPPVEKHYWNSEIQRESAAISSRYRDG